MLLKVSEVRKVKKFANEVTGKTDCKITEYYTDGKENNSGFIKVICRICSDNGKTFEGYVKLLVCIQDRARSYVE